MDVTDMLELLFAIGFICIALIIANAVARKLYKKRSKKDSQNDIYPLW